MVKFAKNGSNATTAAVKLARAYTGKEMILRCIDQPFFSIDDWFICDTEINSGIPKETQSGTKHFSYNNISSLKNIVEKYKDMGIACVILEPAATEEPKKGYLEAVKKVCEENNIILIFDEVVSGFRFHPKGAQYLYGVTPDLSTFGKSMANGFSISALVGKEEIMKLGGLEHDKERIFLLSTTYGGETHHLRAAQKSIELLNQNDYEVTKHIWEVGRIVKENYNSLVLKYDLGQYTQMMGVNCRPYFYFKDNVLRTLFSQEMIKYGVLIQGIVPSFSHGDSEVAQTIEAFDKSLKLLANAIDNKSVEKLLVGKAVKPVFRKYN